MVVTLVKTIELPQAWMSKDEAIKYFGYSNHRSAFQVLLKEFKEHPNFKDGYRLPTPQVPTVHIVKFDEFLIWRDRNKYKRNKK